MELNEKIRALRISLGLTLEDVGNAVGVGKSTVLKWENGDIANMRRDKILKLANILQTTPAFLMGWDEDAPTVASETPPEYILVNIPLLSVLEDYCEHFGKDFDQIIRYYQDPKNKLSLIYLISGRGLKGNDVIALKNILGVRRIEDAVKAIDDNPARYLPLTLSRAEVDMILAFRKSSQEENENFTSHNREAI